MQFNGEANDQDLCTLADNKAGSNDISFPLKKKAMYANMKSREVWMRIWKAYGGWVADDYNNSGEPEVSTNLSTSLRNVYAFASAQFITTMEWLDSAGNWNPLKPITLEEISDMGYAETEFMNTPGRPIYYRPVQNGVRIYPDSDAARTNALRAKIGRDISAFVPGDTTKTPGWDSMFHEGLAIGMALEYAKDNTLAVAAALAGDWSTFLDSIGTHWETKYRQHFPPAFRKRKATANQFVS